MIYGMTNEELIKELNTCRMAQAVMDNTVADLEAKLAQAVKLIDLAVELARWDRAPKLRDDMIDFTTEIKGESHDRSTTEK